MKKWMFAISLALLYSYIQRNNGSPKVYYLKELPFGYNGFTIPPFGVFIKEEHREAKSLLLHELVHWKQYQREGLVRFLLNYAHAHANNGYDLNPYEVEARFEESDFCKSQYTYCVRNGLAKAIYNPNFRQ